MPVKECQERLHKAFGVYDQAVDIISCWEAFLNHSYGGVFTDFHFDRFPTIPTDGDAITPDFSVCFNDEYGIIGEVKRTFAEHDDGFSSNVEQLQRYDLDAGLLASDGSRVVPETIDILLLISGSASPQIGTRLNERLVEEEEHTFDNNPVLVRYQYNTSATISRYEFQRETQLDFEFRDDTLPNDIALSSKMGPAGQYETLEVYPKHFTPLKVAKPICNDEPPGHYLATILWHKIFPEFLAEQQYREWYDGSAQKTMDIDVTLDELTSKVNDDYLRGGRIQRTWIRDALDFLSSANLADVTNTDTYRIKFRGLVRDVGANNFQEGTQERDQQQELASIFISRYCEFNESTDDAIPADQSSIDQF
jgi:hypothetical protein